MASLLRGLGERLLRDRTRLRRLPAAFDSLPIMASSAGGLAMVLKPMSQVDPVLFATVDVLVKPGDTVWDIGANIGLFSVASAARAGAKGRVIAFEPDTELVRLLRKSSGLLPASAAPVTVVPAGIAGRTGVRNFQVATRARAANTLAEYGNSQMGGVRQTQSIACYSADDCLAWLPVPDVVKIDVEGAEIELLGGAARLLADVAPAIACEVAPANAPEVTRILRSLGYHLYDAARAPRLVDEIEMAAWNTIAIPAAKLSRFGAIAG